MGPEGLLLGFGLLNGLSLSPETLPSELRSDERFCWRHIQFNLTGDHSRRRVLIAPSSILQAEGHLPSPNGS